jgi:hypothetical protein
LKIEKERPGVLELIEEKTINYKHLYEDLQKDVLSISYERFDIFGAIKGNLEEYDGFVSLDIAKTR